MTLHDVKIGCCGFGQYKRHDYFKRLGTVEYLQSFFTPPADSVCTKLRKQAPEGFDIVVKAWQLVTHEASGKGHVRLTQPAPGLAANYGSFQDTEEVRQAWQATLKTAELLEARVVLYETPASFTPTARNRQNMASFFARVPRDGWTHVWEPQGVWSAPEVQGLCDQLGLVACCDPLVLEAFPVGAVAYLKIRNLGSPHPMSDSELIWLAQGLADYDSAHVIFNTSRMFTDARKLVDILNTF